MLKTTPNCNNTRNVPKAGNPFTRILCSLQSLSLVMSFTLNTCTHPTTISAKIHEQDIDNIHTNFLCVLNDSIFKHMIQILSNNIKNTCDTDANNTTLNMKNRATHIEKSALSFSRNMSDKTIREIPNNKSVKLKLSTISEFCVFLFLHIAPITIIAPGKFSTFVVTPKVSRMPVITLLRSVSGTEKSVVLFMILVADFS